QHVAFLAQGGEQPSRGEPPGNRSFPWSAGEVDEGIGEALGTGGREHHHPERDLPPAPGGPVLEDLVRATARIRRKTPLRAGRELEPARRLRRGPGRGLKASGRGEGDEKGEDGEYRSLISHWRAPGGLCCKPIVARDASSVNWSS